MTTNNRGLAKTSDAIESKKKSNNQTSYILSQLSQSLPERSTKHENKSALIQSMTIGTYFEKSGILYDAVTNTNEAAPEADAEIKEENKNKIEIKINVDTSTPEVKNGIKIPYPERLSPYNSYSRNSLDERAQDAKSREDKSNSSFEDVMSKSDENELIFGSMEELVNTRPGM